MSSESSARVEHFLRFASNLILDTGDNWEIEDFQVEFFEPLLMGVKEVWTIIPEGNTKTTSMAAFALYHAMSTRSPWVPIVASSRDQAEIMAQQAYGIIRATPFLEWNKRRKSGYFEILEGYRIIRCYRDGKPSGRGIKVYAADVGTSDGGIPTLVLCDEGHRWPDLQPYRLWKGKLGKRGGQIAMTSTAGAPGEEFEETRDKIRNAAHNHTVTGAHALHYSPHIVMNEWAVEKPEYITDMAKVKLANPFSGITTDTLREEFDSPTTDLGDWKRLKCNIPARTVAAAITELEWSKAFIEMEIPEGAHVQVGADVAWKHDTFALAPLWLFFPSLEDELDDEEDDEEERFEIVGKFRLLGKPKILVPPRDGSTMHPDAVKEAFIEINDVNPIDTVIIDLERAEDIAAWLEDDMGITVIDRPQGNERAVEDYDAFMKALRNGTLKHNGDRGLRNHVMNAIARRLPADNKFRFDRPSQSRARRRQAVRVIDALTAAAMVNQYADTFVEESDEPLVAVR